MTRSEHLKLFVILSCLVLGIWLISSSYAFLLCDFKDAKTFQDVEQGNFLEGDHISDTITQAFGSFAERSYSFHISKDFKKGVDVPMATETYYIMGFVEYETPYLIAASVDDKNVEIMDEISKNTMLGEKKIVSFPMNGMIVPLEEEYYTYALEVLNEYFEMPDSELKKIAGGYVIKTYDIRLAWTKFISGCVTILGMVVLLFGKLIPTVKEEIMMKKAAKKAMEISNTQTQTKTGVDGDFDIISLDD